MKRTKMVYGNCLLGGMYLCLRGRVKKIGFVSSNAWYVPAHVVVETKRHNILHFRYASKYSNPLYYKGCFEGVRSRDIYKYLQKEKREIICVINPNVFFLLGLFCFFFLMIPWVLYWPCEVLLYRIPKDILGLMKRCMSRLLFSILNK